MKQKGTFSLKKRQTRIMLYLLMAIIAVIVSFSVAGAWFMDRDKADSPMDMAGAVIVKLVGTGEDGAIQNFKELYDSDGGAYPGDKILDSIKVQMGENTEESVLRVQYSINILDEEKNVKTENLTEAETNLITMLKNDLKTKTTLYSSDWAQTSSDWIYYKHLASGKTKPIDLFDEYSLPLSDSQMDNNYQELSFRISLVAEAIQAANILTHEEWNTDLTNLSDSTLMERVIKYNGERFADVDEVLPYVETTGGQYIDTGYAANLNTAVEVTFQTNSGNKWLFGSRTSGGAANTYALHVSSMNSIWFQMANDSSSTQFSTSNFSNKQTTITVNKDAAYLNGTQIGTVGRTSFGENTLSLYLGVINANGSGTDRPFVGKIYSSRIWDNGELVRFFVPARDKDGNIGFYDLVTKQMYLNAGTGNFAYGHSINYIVNGGTIDADAPKTFVSSNLPITLPVPTRAGYEFGGWFLSSDFSGAAQTTIPANTDSNVYVYAKWIKTYNITYHLGGGENAESNPQTFNEKTLPLTLATPTREGFAFAGWYQNPAYSGNQMTTIEIGTEKNVSLWAKWNAVEYSVSYNLNGGTNNDQNITKYTILDTPVKLYNPTYEGFVFEGWFTKSDFSGERITYLSKDNLGDVTLYAKWSQAYTITYNTNGGLNDGRNPSVFTENTETFSLYEATKLNFTFLGWFDNEALSGTPVTQITKGTKSNVVLWAKWSSAQITVTFNPNGGGVSPMTKVVKKGGTYGELPTPTKAGYKFDGWFTEIDGGTQVLPTTSVLSNADHTLFAQWTENVYTVTYNLDGGTNAAGNPATFKCSNLPIALLDATKDGEYFAGWYLDAEFTKRVTKIDAGSLKNIELWARFSQSPLVFDLVGSSAYSVRAANTSISGNIEIPQTYNGKPVVVIQNSAFKDCSSLTSILIPNSIKSIGINAFENCSNITGITIPEGVTLIGNNTFKGCVKLASASFPTSIESFGANAFAGCTSLTSIVLPKNIQEIGANAFANCSKLATIEVFGDTPATLKTGVFSSNVSKIYVKPSLVSTYKTLWAEYKDKIVGFTQYTITYNLNGGTNSTKNITSFTKIDVPIKLYAPTKENADFLGWYKTSDFSGEKVSEITTASNITLYARWDRKMTITYVLNGGVNLSNLTTITDSMLPYTLSDAARSGYTFLGWFTDELLQNPITEITIFGDITVYANWEMLDPNLVFTLNSDGSGYSVKAKTTSISGAVKIPATYDGVPVTTILDKSFAQCTKLTAIYIPDSVTKIESTSEKNSPFYGCDGSMIIYCGATSKPSGWGNYWNCYDYFSGRSDLQVIWGVKGLPQQNSDWRYVEKNDGTLNLVSFLGSATKVSTPNSFNGMMVTEICFNCFKDNATVTQISIADGVKIIDYNAFQNCTALTQIYIPAGVATISNTNSTTGSSGYWCSPFYQCSSSVVIYCGAKSLPSGWEQYWNSYNYNRGAQYLQVVWGVKSFPQQNEDWEYIEKLDGTIRVEKYIGSATDVIVPSTLSGKIVSEIYNKCFIDNSTITSVSIANSVTSIGNRAFQHCTSMINIIIPSSVSTISASSYSDSPFYGWNGSAVIYCESSSKPDGWGGGWNYYDSTNSLKTYYKTTKCIHEDGVWAYDSNGEIKTFDDISWIIDVEPTTEAEGSKHGVCPICGATLTGVIPKKIKITITNDSSYPWTITNNSAAVSTNKSNSTSSTLTLTFTGNGKIRIKYKTSSEANYDKLTIIHNSTTIGTYSGTTQSTFTTLADITVSSGDTIKFTYSKDGSQSSGSDCAWVEWEIVE